MTTTPWPNRIIALLFELLCRISRQSNGRRTHHFADSYFRKYTSTLTPTLKHWFINGAPFITKRCTVFYSNNRNMTMGIYVTLGSRLHKLHPRGTLMKHNARYRAKRCVMGKKKSHQ